MGSRLDSQALSPGLPLTPKGPTGLIPNLIIEIDVFTEIILGSHAVLRIAIERSYVPTPRLPPQQHFFLKVFKI